MKLYFCRFRESINLYMTYNVVDPREISATDNLDFAVITDNKDALISRVRDNPELEICCIEGEPSVVDKNPEPRERTKTIEPMMF